MDGNYDVDIEKYICIIYLVMIQVYDIVYIKSDQYSFNNGNFCFAGEHQN